jgi:hypothetical protein
MLKYSITSLVKHSIKDLRRAFIFCYSVFSTKGNIWIESSVELYISSATRTRFRLLSFDTTRTYRKRRIQQFFCCCVYSLRRERDTEPLPCNDKGDTHSHTDWWEGCKKYAAEMGSDTMILYILSFIKTGAGIQKLMGGIHKKTAR